MALNKIAACPFIKGETHHKSYPIHSLLCTNLSALVVAVFPVLVVFAGRFMLMLMMMVVVLMVAVGLVGMIVIERAAEAC